MNLNVICVRFTLLKFRYQKKQLRQIYLYELKLDQSAAEIAQNIKGELMSPRHNIGFENSVAMNLSLNMRRIVVVLLPVILRI